MHTRVGIALLLLLGAPALADKTADEARRHYEAGGRHYSLAEFDQAIVEYKEAYKLKPDPAFLFNIAQSYRLANDPKQAIYFYRSYLRNAEDGRNRAEVEEHIRKLEQEQADKERAAPPPVTPVVASPSTMTTTLTATPATRDERRPIYKRWWLWTGVGVVAAGVALGVGLGLGLSSEDSPRAHFGVHDVF